MLATSGRFLPQTIEIRYHGPCILQLVRKIEIHVSWKFPRFNSKCPRNIKDISMQLSLRQPGTPHDWLWTLDCTIALWARLNRKWEIGIFPPQPLFSPGMIISENIFGDCIYIVYIWGLVEHSSVWRYPKCWTIPIPILFPVPNIFDTDTGTFSGTKFFRYWFRDFFRYQIFPIPNFSDTTRKTNKKFLVPVCIRYQYPL